MKENFIKQRDLIISMMTPLPRSPRGNGRPTEDRTIAGYPFFACLCGTGEMKKERK